MRALALAAALAATATTAAGAQRRPHAPRPVADSARRDTARGAARDGAREAARDSTREAARDSSPPYRPGVDVQDYDLHLELPESGRTIVGRAVLTVRRTARLDTLVLDLIGMQVRAVTVDREPVVFSRDVATVGVPLPRGRAGTFRVEVDYSGAPDDGLIITTDSAGRWNGFGDNWPNRARHWIPSVDHPSDKATVSWDVVAPSSRTVIANGALVSRREIDGRPGWTETKWRESRPIATYLMVIAAAPLVRYDLGQTACGYGSTPDGCVPQSVYVAPEQQFTLPGAFGDAPDIVRWFAELVGPFPYEKLAHLQSSTRYGGMENATAIFYADAIVRRDAMTAGLIAHETAHQWFGDAVTERAWPHVWLSEGFATYFAALWAGHADGDSAFRSAMARIRANVIGDTTAVTHRPVIDTIETNLYALLNRNSYDKGGFVLHMLRRQIGDSAFFQGLRRYYAAHRDGNALTEDLRAAMEETSGKQLGWFFDQWLRRPGFPEIAATWSYDMQTRRVVLVITQSERFGAYRFPLTVAVSAEGGETQRFRVEVPAERETRVVLPTRMAAAPTAVTLDPDVELLAAMTTSHE